MSDEARLYSRFVRPIYDAIDGRQYKNAIKLCQNKKVAGLDIVQVLKAHCLERTGRQDEALDICRAVQERKPTDETLLNTMGLVFRLCGVEHEMLTSYEFACAQAEPPNEELFQSLFVAYARKGDFLKQQQTALKMFKAFGEIKYVCWAVLSMLLQVQHAGAPAKMLGLADRMLLKTMREAKSDDGEALQLLVHIFQLQDKHEEALQAFDEFAPLMIESVNKKNEPKHEEEEEKKHGHHGHVHGPGCSHSHAHGDTTAASTKGRSAEGEGTYDEDIELGPLQAIDRLALEATLSKQVAQWKRSGDVYATLLDQYNADDWTYLTEFITARIQERQSASEFASVEKKLLTKLKALAEKPGNAFLRGPWLALVHVQSEKLRLLVQSGGDAKAKKAVEVVLVDRILAYADRFYTKTCCFSDLKQYFALFHDDKLISEPTKANLIQKLTEMTTKATTAAESSSSVTQHDESTRKHALSQLHRRLFSLKSLRFVGAFSSSSSVAQLETLAKSLVDEYAANAWLNVGATGGQREVQNTDDLLLLAAQLLIEIFQREPVAGRTSVLLEAAALLEFGLDKSAYNFQMKLLLARVYAYVGASGAMLQRHKELDVKHVQLDSLSYLVFDKLLQLCHHTEARRLCDAIRRQHRSTANDTPEYIARAYKLGVYSKVLDMTSFLREKMQNSHMLAIARGEALQFELQDALTGGPAKLTELLNAPRLTQALEELHAMVATTSTAALSANQDRTVVVQWTPTPLVASSASFAPYGERLTECDRSAQWDESLQWIQLQLVVPKLLRGVVHWTAGADTGDALVAEYAETVASLGVLATGDVKARVWQWSVDVATATTAAMAAAATPTATADASSAAAAVAAVDALVGPLQGIRDGVIAALSSSSGAESSVSAYGLSAAALLLRDAGLWAGALLCVTSRAVAKKRSATKKDDALVAALRGVVKSVQDTLAAVESHVKTIHVVGDTTRGDATAPVTRVTVLSADAQRKALANVARAHSESLATLSELLKNAASSMRLFLVK